MPAENVTRRNVREASFADVEPVVETDFYSIYSFPDVYDPNKSTDVVVFPHTVMVKSVTRTEGVNKHSKAVYVRWVSEGARIFSLKRERYGSTQLRVYNSQKRKKNRPARFSDASKLATLKLGSSLPKGVAEKIVYEGKDIVPPFYRAEAFVAWKVVQMFKERNPDIDVEQFPVESIYLYLAYPALRLFAGENTLSQVEKAVQSNSRIWLLEPESRVFIRKAFGKKAMRKDFIKAAAASRSAGALNLCHDLRNIVPFDWLIMLLKDPERNLLTAMRLNEQDGMNNLKSLRKLFSYASLPQRKRLLLEKTLDDQYINPYFYQDIFRAINSVSEEYLVEHLNEVDFTSWKALHDTLAVVQREFSMIPAEVPVTPIAAALDGATYVHEDEEYVVKSPKINHELIKWGSELKNCIASYESAVMQKQTDVFAVYKNDGNLYANLEVRNGRLVQFVQKFNAPAPAGMQTTMQDMIETAQKSIVIPMKAAA